MRNIFCKKSYAKCVGETSPRPYSKESKSKSLDQWSEISHSLFLLYIQVKYYQNILKLKC